MNSVQYSVLRVTEKSGSRAAHSISLLRKMMRDSVGEKTRVCLRTATTWTVLVEAFYWNRD